MLNPRNFGLAAGIVWAVMLFLVTIACVYTGYASEFLSVIYGVYPGYSISFIGSLFGFVYAFLHAFIAFYAFSWLYNWFGRDRNLNFKRKKR